MVMTCEDRLSAGTALISYVKKRNLPEYTEKLSEQSFFLTFGFSLFSEIFFGVAKKLCRLGTCKLTLGRKSTAGISVYDTYTHKRIKAVLCPVGNVYRINKAVFIYLVGISYKF